MRSVFAFSVIAASSLCFGSALAGRSSNAQQVVDEVDGTKRPPIHLADEVGGVKRPEIHLADEVGGVKRPMIRLVEEVAGAKLRVIKQTALI